MSLLVQSTRLMASAHGWSERRGMPSSVGCPSRDCPRMLRWHKPSGCRPGSERVVMEGSCVIQDSLAKCNGYAAVVGLGRPSCGRRF